MAKKKHVSNNTILYRSETNKVLGGVCGGLAEVFKIDATIIRAIFVLAALFGGSGLLFYLVLWLIVPSESKLSNSSDENIRQNVIEMKERAQRFTADFNNDTNSSKRIIGIVILVFGVLLLLDNMGLSYMFNFSRLWPILVIVVGYLILTRKDR